MNPSHSLRFTTRSVFKDNRLALDFYRGLGARMEDHLRYMWWPAME